MKPRSIYVSAPLDANLEPPQVRFKAELFRMVEQAGLAIELWGEQGRFATHPSWSVRAASDMIDACDGGIVLGLARWRFELADAKQHRVPTESGHFEGALALRRGIPTLILCEQTMWDRGIYYNGGGAYIHKFPLEAPLDWLRTPLFAKAFDDWVAAIKRRPQVFIGSCGKAQALVNELIAYLSGSLGVTHRHYSSGFTPGASLLDEIRRASADCSLGIFVFTKDDPLEGGNGTAAPRDNVVFEAGYFAAARGHERVLVILEDGAKLPADLGGAIYVRLADQRSLASIHTPIRRFIEERL